MANQRHPDQRLVAFALDLELLTAMDDARREAKKDRSTYIREAIVEKLRLEKITLPEGIEIAPDRTGKKHAFPRHAAQGAVLNEQAASSAKVQAAKDRAVQQTKRKVKDDPKKP